VFKHKTRLPGHSVKSQVAFATKWHRDPREMLLSANMISLNVLTRPAYSAAADM
jgi:hypothetical protein